MSGWTARRWRRPAVFLLLVAVVIPTLARASGQHPARATPTASPVHVMLDVWWDRYQRYGAPDRQRLDTLLRDHLRSGDQVNVTLPAEHLFRRLGDGSSGCNATRYASFWRLKDHLEAVLGPHGVTVRTRIDFTRAVTHLARRGHLTHVAIKPTVHSCKMLLQSRAPYWISYDWEPPAGKKARFSGDEFKLSRAESLFRAAHDAAMEIGHGQRLWIMPGYQSLGITNNLHFKEGTPRVDWGRMSRYFDTINFQTQRQLCGFKNGRTRNGARGDSRSECVGKHTKPGVMSSLFGDRSYGKTHGAVWTLANEVRRARGPNYPVVIQVSQNWSPDKEILSGIDKARRSTVGIHYFYIWYERQSFPGSDALQHLVDDLNSPRFGR